MAVVTFVRRHYATIGYLILLVALVVSIFQVRQAINEQKRISADTNRIVREDVDRLQKLLDNERKTIETQEAQIEAATFVLTEQAAPAIVAMGKQIKELGGEPPAVLLSPNEPPFPEQNR